MFRLPRHFPVQTNRLCWRGPVIALVAGTTAGCSGTVDPGELATGALEALPAAAFAIAAGQSTPVGSPTEIYARIARGALTCWLGGQGPLRETHSFHAVSVPHQKGGQSKIIIFQSPRSKDSSRKGVQAFRIAIAPQGSSAVVGVENVKIPEPLGGKMVADTHRWAAGEEGCVAGGVTEGWAANTPASPSATKTSTRSKAKKK